MPFFFMALSDSEQPRGFSLLKIKQTMVHAMRRHNAKRDYSVISDYWISYTDMALGLLILVLIVLFLLIGYVGSNYIKRSDLDKTYVEKTQIEKEYIKRSELDKTYVEKTQIEKEYIKKDKVESDYVKKELFEGLENDNRRLKEGLEKNINNIREIINRISDDISSKTGNSGRKLKVSVDTENLVIHISADTLGFKSGSHELTAEQKQIIKNVIAESFYDVFTSGKYGKMVDDSVDTIFIEGHTDSDRYSGLRGNWGLSTFRAIEFWENFKPENAGFFENYTNSRKQKMFSVSGYGETRAVVPNSDEINKSKNRRIDIKFIPRTDKESILGN